MSGVNWGRLAIVGAPVYIAATVGTYMFMKADSPAPEGGPALPDDPFVTPGAATSHEVYDATAATYDASIGTDELAMGLPLLRRWLLTRARGRVLEVAAGTGRNVPYYAAPAVTHVQLADRSPAMLQVSRGKAAGRWGSAAFGEGSGAPLTWGLTRAASESLPFPDASFDTCVSTFSLCSVDDPAAAVREMARVTVPGGRLLFLEHGRSASWPWMNSWLDASAPAHAQKWGCWWNRDLLGVVGEAEAAGVVRVTKRWTTHFGTTVWVEAEPADRASEGHEPAR